MHMYFKVIFQLFKIVLYYAFIYFCRSDYDRLALTSP